jgi:hypothetical protein
VSRRAGARLPRAGHLHAREPGVPGRARTLCAPGQRAVRRGGRQGCRLCTLLLRDPRKRRHRLFAVRDRLHRLLELPPRREDHCRGDPGAVRLGLPPAAPLRRRVGPPRTGARSLGSCAIRRLGLPLTRARRPDRGDRL